MTIGILPAAGNASRIHGLPKFLLPVGDTYLLKWHVQHMEQLGHCSVYIGTNPDNDEMVCEYEDSGLTYEVSHYKTMSETVLSLHYMFVDDLNNPGNGDDLTIDYYQHYLFGMPDSYMEDPLVYSKLATAINGDCDVAVATFRARTDQHKKAGMVRTAYGKVTEVIDKPETTDMVWLWGALAWKPAFWEHLRGEDPHVGYALPRAIAAGLDVRAVRCDGNYWDCGTSTEYYELIRHLEGEKVVE